MNFGNCWLWNGGRRQGQSPPPSSCLGNQLERNPPDYAGREICKTLSHASNRHTSPLLFCCTPYHSPNVLESGSRGAAALAAPARPVCIAASRRCCWWPRGILCRGSPPLPGQPLQCAPLARPVPGEHEASALCAAARGRPRRIRGSRRAAGAPSRATLAAALPGYKLDGAVADALPAARHCHQLSDAAAAAPRGRSSLEASTLCLCPTYSSSVSEKGAITRRLKAGWHSGDLLWCTDWTLLRLFPPLDRASRSGPGCGFPYRSRTAGLRRHF